MSSYPTSSSKVVTRILFVSLLIVALSTVGLFFTSGYGMQLYQIVVLGAWSLLAVVSSDMFVDQNHQFIWPIAAILNVFLFLLLALPLYRIFRQRALLFASIILVIWLVFYLCCLFILFPATDGP